MNKDISNEIQQQVMDAFQKQMPLAIKGNETKSFYGNAIEGTLLDVSPHQGIISYEPTELVLTARSGTSLNEIESVLNENNQQLAFEPPHFSNLSNSEEATIEATLGGTVACGLSGPARANYGSVRDFVLGCEIVNGKGEQLKFGGQVMKNVAGYDVSRLMCGSLGTLGVILNTSLKVLPKPELETSLSFELTPNQANTTLSQWCAKPYPITASCYHNNILTLRLAGNAQAVKATQLKLGGEQLNNSKKFWQQLKEQQHEFFNTETNLWRISSKPNFEHDIPNINTEVCLTEWHGALHWIKTNQNATVIQQHAARLGGHAILFRQNNINDNNIDIFHPLENQIMKIHQNLKNAFDPKHILNRNKMYAFSYDATH